MLTKATFLLFVYTVNASQSCVYNAPLIPKCEATCGGCGLSTCMPYEIYGVVESWVTPSEWGLVNAATSYINMQKSATVPDGLCKINNTKATFPLVDGHKDFFDFKTVVQEWCIDHPDEKIATVTDPSTGATGVTHPCFVNCQITKDNYTCSLGTLVDAVSKHAKGDPIEVNSRASVVAGKDPCSIQDDADLNFAIEMFGMEPQMSVFDIAAMMGSRDNAIYVMQIPNQLPDGTTFQMSYEDAAAFVDLMSNTTALFEIFRVAWPLVYDYCTTNPDEKFVDMAALNMGAMQGVWGNLVKGMFGDPLFSEEVKGLNALSNQCICNMDYFETNAAMLKLFVESTFTNVPQPCYKDTDGKAFSYNELKTQSIETFKNMAFDNSDQHLGCDHYTCLDGATQTVERKPVSIYTFVAVQSFYKAKLSPALKTVYSDAIFGNSVTTPGTYLNDIGMPSTCSEVKSSYQAQQCCLDA